MNLQTIRNWCFVSLLALTACNSPFKEIQSIELSSGTVEKIISTDVKDTLELKKYILKNLPASRVFYYFFDTKNDLSKLKSKSITETMCDPKSKEHFFKAYIVMHGKIYAPWVCPEKDPIRTFTSKVVGSSF